MKQLISNYQPISILTCCYKMIENSFIVIHANQYGFQSNVSTVNALLDVANFSYSHIISNQFTALVFIDPKAFDTVLHSTLSKQIKQLLYL